MAITTTALIALSLLAGSWALRQAWLGDRRSLYASMAAACLALAVAIAVWGFGGEIGIPIAIAGFAPAALLVVYLGRTVRPPLSRPVREGSALRRDIPYRDTARILASVVLTVPVALAIGGVLAVLLPFEAQTRVIVTLYLLPLVWACAMAWTISVRSAKTLAIGGAGVSLFCAAVLVPRLF